MTEPVKGKTPPVKEEKPKGLLSKLKDAADDKEKEIQLDEADQTINLIKEVKEAHEANDNISDDELAKRLS